MTKCRCGKAHRTANFHFKVDNKLRGAFGETDFSKKVVRINKKKHRKGADVKHLTPNKDGSENLLTTIVHEQTHINHPQMGERKVEKLARAMKRKMSPKQKARMYAKVQ